MRIHAIYESAADGQPCGGSHIRIIRPFEYLAAGQANAAGTAAPASERTLTFSCSNQLPDDPIDALVFERLWKDGGVSIPVAENLLNQVRARRIPFIYFIDDNLLDLNRFTESGTRPNIVDRFLVGYFLRAADAVVVSTEALKSRFSHFNARIHVLPNALDARLFPADPFTLRQPVDESRPITIGYMGTYTHLDDLLTILQPLRKVLIRHRDRVRFEMVGISADPAILNLFAGCNFGILEPTGCFHYPDFVPWASQHMRWDIGIAPLADTPFNQCKSDIKYLDYALLGIPGIFSDLAPYRDSVRHGETGLKADGHATWEAALENLISDSVLRQKLARQAHANVSATRTLAVRASDWLKVLPSAAPKLQH